MECVDECVDECVEKKQNQSLRRIPSPYASPIEKSELNFETGISKHLVNTTTVLGLGLLTKKQNRTRH